MKLIDILKKDNLCKFRKESEIRLKNGLIKINGMKIYDNIDLDIISEPILVHEWFDYLKLTIIQLNCLLVFCTPSQPSNISNLDYLFDINEKWEVIMLEKLPFLKLINENRVKLLQISKKEYFILRIK